MKKKIFEIGSRHTSPERKFRAESKNHVFRAVEARVWKCIKKKLKKWEKWEKKKDLKNHNSAKNGFKRLGFLVRLAN